MHMRDDDWLRALRKHATDADRRWPHDSGPASEAARLLGQRAKEDPQRFATLALRRGDDIPAVAIDNIIWNIAGAVDAEVLAEVCENAVRLHGDVVGRSICHAAQKAGGASGRSKWRSL